MIAMVWQKRKLLTNQSYSVSTKPLPKVFLAQIHFDDKRYIARSIKKNNQLKLS